MNKPTISNLLEGLSQVQIAIPDGVDSNIARDVIESHAATFDHMMRPVPGWGSIEDPITEDMLNAAQIKLAQLFASNVGPAIPALVPLNTLLLRIFEAKKAVIVGVRAQLGGEGVETQKA
jgi:hypothetical protein